MIGTRSMAGQCEFHPFEFTAEVCGVCYADICARCVTTIRSRPDPICRDCAITMSGVRGSTKPQIRGDQSTVEARRAALHPEEPNEDALTGDETEWIRDDAGGIRGRISAMAAGFLPGSANKPNSKTSPGGPVAAISRAKKSPEAAFGEDSAVHKLDQLRQTDPAPASSQSGDNQLVDEVAQTEPEPASPSPRSVRNQLEEPAPTDDSDGAVWPELDQTPPDEPAVNKKLVDHTHWSEASIPDLNQDPFAAR